MPGRKSYPLVSSLHVSGRGGVVTLHAFLQARRLELVPWVFFSPGDNCPHTVGPPLPCFLPEMRFIDS